MKYVGAQDTEALRPAFNERLVGLLMAGDSVNLTGAHGQGRRRTLADLRRCLPPSIHVLQANLRRYPGSLAAMLDDLATQAGCGVVEQLGRLFDRLEHSGERCLTILHNFDELRPGTEGGFDDHFFAQLESIRNRPNIALLCVSECLPADWPLHIDAMELPPLTAKQLLDELARRQPPVESALWPEIATWLARQHTPYALLEQADEEWFAQRPWRG